MTQAIRMGERASEKRLTGSSLSCLGDWYSDRRYGTIDANQQQRKDAGEALLPVRRRAH